MSSSAFPIEPIRNCHNCGAPLALGAVVCPQCHALVHSEELVRISTAAKALEEQGELLKAHEAWLSALPLLPPDSTQAEWIRGQAYKLEITAKNAPPAAPKYGWAKKLGPLAPIAILLAKGKSLLFVLFKLKFLLSLLSFVWIYWLLYGPKFGIGFAALILIHEMGHYVDIKRRGLPADMPVFLPGFGAYVRWQALGVTRQTRAEISLAGPLAGFIGAAICAAVWFSTHDGIWGALARASAWLNVVNLTPVWMLDGGQAANALDKSQRFVLLAACLGLAALTRDWSFAIVAAGTVYRLFTKDLPPQGSPGVTGYFVAVLAALAVVMYFIPGQGFRPR
ncbi:MAG TPA: site-2 protease family protein [Candidatus Acidoferrum sp.]|nr:site-2 protease family protein [Candidatus Acidoferrum sp.]